MQLLQQIHSLWETRRNDLLGSASEVHQNLERASMSNDVSSALSVETLRDAGMLYKRAYDPQHGGFGGAPKFPQPSQPQFLLRYALRFRDDESTRMVLHTCDRMAAAGIQDPL